MTELPLFPLNTVLFPGMPITLHIFEARYRLMVQYCLDHNEPFGVVLIKRGVEANGPAAEPHLVGCVAEIAQATRLEGGLFDIIAVGQERFRIYSLRTDQPYLVGVVEMVPLQMGQPDELERPAHRLRPWVERYLTVMAQASEVELDTSQLPEEPLSLAYLAATLVQAPAEDKQRLLNLDDPQQLLGALCTLYQREIAILKAMLAPTSPGDEQTPFSLS
jgi:uncharacterized protein